MEHPKIRFAREYCKKKGVKYQIKGTVDALYIYSDTYQKYIQACYSLLNLSEEGIALMIDKFIEEEH